MSYSIKGNEAYKALRSFREYASSLYHERYRFPYLCGSYFAYRKIDVMRVVAVAKSISSQPRYLDVGCGYGDFLQKVREFIPNAIGIEKNANMFYAFGIKKPDYIRIQGIESFEKEVFDVIFVGWMDPGIDFRKNVTKYTNCVITTFDAGGQCGINGQCDYEEYGFDRVACWITPSWIDVNYELMNKYYTSINHDIKKDLFKLRSAHNIWCIYARNEISNTVSEGLKSWIGLENKLSLNNERFDFESVLDDCGFEFCEEILKPTAKGKILWKVIFD
jgi:SAM-dependent methyltransferase